MKRLGVKKPAWLPDFGKDKRKALLERFFASPISRQVWCGLQAGQAGVPPGVAWRMAVQPPNSLPPMQAS